MSKPQLSNLDRDIKASGLVMGGEFDYKMDNQSYYWAEITPSAGAWYRQFLPSVRRWWFEVHQTESFPSDRMGIGQITHAYAPYGSGGSYTLRGCMRKAQLALETASEEESHE